MEEHEFLPLADAELSRIEQVLEKQQADAAASWDFEIRPGGIIQLDFEDGSRIIINRHAAAREIWIAARAGGFHFRPPTEIGADWRDTRSGVNLDALLSRCISEQAGGLPGLG